MKIYSGYPIDQPGIFNAPCPECENDSAWIPILDFEDEEITVACVRSRCQATVRRPMEYGERIRPNRVRVLISR